MLYKERRRVPKDIFSRTIEDVQKRQRLRGNVPAYRRPIIRVRVVGLQKHRVHFRKVLGPWLSRKAGYDTVVVPGYRIDKKTGKPVKSVAHLDASQRLRQAASKKIKVKRG